MVTLASIFLKLLHFRPKIFGCLFFISFTFYLYLGYELKIDRYISKIAKDQL